MIAITTHIHYPDRVRVGSKDHLPQHPWLSLVAEATVTPNGFLWNYN